MNNEGVLNLSRFLDPQMFQFEGALAEMKRGQKTGHWIWFIFPQLKGLGRSWQSDYYGISGLEEAQAYLADPVLGARLREVTKAVLSHPGSDITELMGSSVDAMKLRSSMTLFDLVSPGDIFGDVLDVFYGGKRDQMTLRIRDIQDESKDICRYQEVIQFIDSLPAPKCIHEFTIKEAQHIEKTGVVAWGLSDQGWDGLLCKDGKFYFRCVEPNNIIQLPFDRYEEICSNTLSGWECLYLGLGGWLIIQKEYYPKLCKLLNGLEGNIRRSILAQYAFKILYYILKNDA